MARSRSRSLLQPDLWESWFHTQNETLRKVTQFLDILNGEFYPMNSLTKEATCETNINWLLSLWWEVSKPHQTKSKMLLESGQSNQVDSFLSACSTIPHHTKSNHPYIYWFEVYLRFLWGLSQVSMRFISAFSQVHLRFLWGLSQVSLRFISGFSEVYLRFLWGLSQVSLRLISGLSQVSQRLISSLSQVSLRFISGLS